MKPMQKCELLGQLDLICGDMSPNVARVFARLPLPDASGDWWLRGHLRGPESVYSATLPATVTMRDLGAGPTLLAAITVPDPCFWSPTSPMLYQARVELMRDRDTVEVTELPLGMRRLGTSRRDLVLESKRWVLRAADRSNAATPELETWHDTETAMWISPPDFDLCREASRRGVLLVTELTGPLEVLQRQVRQMACWPAAAISVLRGDLPEGANPSEWNPNMLFAQRFAADEPLEPAPWCQIALCEVDDPARFARRTAPLTIPVVAVRPFDQPATIETLRAGCDRLQRDLAPYGDYAGYIV
jgi:hypothetical protein